MPKKPTIYFVAFDQAEVLDFSGTFDVFSMARVATYFDPYDMKIVSVGGKNVTLIHDFKLKVGRRNALEDVQPTQDDIVVIPGGATAIIDAINDGAYDTKSSNADPDSDAQKALTADCQTIVNWLKDRGGDAGVLATVCVGAFFGAKAGIFDGKQVTTHHGLLKTLETWIGSKSKLPTDQRAQVQHGPRYVLNPTDDKAKTPLIMSSAGVSAGMDLAFEMLQLVLCPNARHRTETLMEYNGTTNFASVQPDMPAGLRLCGYRKNGRHRCSCGNDGPSPHDAPHALRQGYQLF